MKKILFLCLIALLFTTKLEARIYALDEINPCEDAFCDKDGNLVHGDLRAYYENGKLKIQGSYEFGLPEGTFKLYYENGVLNQEENFKRGNKNGLKRTYDEFGRLNSETIFQDGLIEGNLKVYYPNGKVLALMSYQNGKLDGVSQFFDEEGRLRAELHVQKGNAIAGYDYDEQGNKKRADFKEIQEFMNKYPQ